MTIPMKNFVVNIRNAILHYNGGAIVREANHNLTFLKINILKNYLKRKSPIFNIKQVLHIRKEKRISQNN